MTREGRDGVGGPKIATFRVVTVPVGVLSRPNMTGMICWATGFSCLMDKQECAPRELNDILVSFRALFFIPRILNGSHLPPFVRFGTGRS